MITRPSILRFSTLLFSVALLASGAEAQDVQVRSDYQGTEAVLLTPWPVFNRSLESLASPRKAFQEKAQNVIWNVGLLQLNVSSVEVTGESRFDASTPANQQLSLVTRDLSIVVNVDKISIDQVIDYDLGGATIHVHVRTDCGPFTLTEKSAQATGLLAFEFQGPDVTTQIRKFNLQYPPQSWTLANFTCRGPSDLPDVVRQEITTRLQNAETVRSFVEKILNDRMQSTVSEAVQSARFPRLLPVNGVTPVTAEFTDSSATDQSLLSHAKFTWDAVSTKGPKKRRPFRFADVPKDLKPNEVTFVFPEQGVTDFINAQLAAQPQIIPVDLSQQPDFREIWKHPLKLAFGWPDLLNYTADSPFSLELQRPEALALTWSMDGTASSDFPIRGVVRSMRDNRWWDYIPLTAQTQAKAALNLTDGNLKIVVNPVVSNLQAQYGKAYVDQYHPNPKIPIEMIQTFLNNSLKDLTYSAALPALDLREAGTARATGVRPTGLGQIVIPFELVQTQGGHR